MLLEIAFFHLCSPDIHGICASSKEFAFLVCNARVSDCSQALMSVPSDDFAAQISKSERLAFGVLEITFFPFFPL